MKIINTKKFRKLRSENYSYNFNKINGYFERWGKTQEDDPDYSPFGNEILDIEVSTICNGVPGLNGIESPCKFCYKSNTKIGRNMTLDTFKTILSLQPQTLTQIAIGADAKGEANPDLFAMMEYARNRGIIPNITIANISDATAVKLVNVIGALAVSRYENKDICYNSVKKCNDAFLKKKIFVKKKK